MLYVVRSLVLITTLQCKPALHNLTANRIFGQEVAEMLVEVLRLREYHRLDKYTVRALLPAQRAS